MTVWAIESKGPNKTEWSFVCMSTYPDDESFAKKMAERWTINNEDGWVYRAVKYQRVEEA